MYWSASVCCIVNKRFRKFFALNKAHFKYNWKCFIHVVSQGNIQLPERIGSRRGYWEMPGTVFRVGYRCESRWCYSHFQMRSLPILYIVVREHLYPIEWSGSCSNCWSVSAASLPDGLTYFCWGRIPLIVHPAWFEWFHTPLANPPAQYFCWQV